MQFVFFDTETTSINSTFGQMLEFSAVTCDKNLDLTTQILSLQSRLRPHIIPELGALLITNKTIEDINSNPLSHYQMVMEILKVSKQWTPSTWIGWNTIEFDFKWLRQAFYQCLQQPYFHQFYGNRRADALPIARSSYLLGETKLKVSLGKRGRPSFKLGDLAKANGITHDAAHTALSDVHATIGITKLVATKCPELWDSSLLTSSKEDTENIIWSNPMFISTESTFGLTTARVMTPICHHPIYNWVMAIDLKVDPLSYLKLSGTLLAQALRKSPKVLRTINTSGNPLILNLKYKDKLTDYRFLNIETLQKRTELIQKNTRLKEQVTHILLEEYEIKMAKASIERNRREKETEEKIHEGYLLPLGEEEQILKIFEEEKKWGLRYELCKGFKDKRLRELGIRLIFEESPKSLPEEIIQDVKNSIDQRLNSKSDVPWTTIAKAKVAIKDAKDFKKTPREKEIMESYENFIRRIEKGEHISIENF